MLYEKIKVGLRLLTLIIDSKLTPKAEAIFKKTNIHIQYRFCAEGTATNQTLDYLGLDRSDKTVFLCVVPKIRAHGLIEKIADTLYLRDRGSGIAFTIPIDGVSNPIMKLLDEESKEILQNKTQNEVNKVMEQASFDLIMAVMNRGYSEKVMEAAKSAGARGGTVVNARQVGLEESLNFWGISIQQEREIIAIVAPKENKTNIMRAIGEKFGMKSEAHGLILSLPVDHIEGIDIADNTEDLI